MMAVRKIVIYSENPEPLRKACEPVYKVNKRVRKLADDLKDTLNAHPHGIGLAAPQINRHLRVIVVRLGGGPQTNQEPDPPIALINPEIIEARQEKRDFDGCLSFPGLFADTIRPHFLRVKGLDENGKTFERIFEDFDAVVVHHEIDHLNGVLFIDRLEKLEDLYQVREDEYGNHMRVPVSVSLEG
jgi:peptide deformylase